MEIVFSNNQDFKSVVSDAVILCSLSLLFIYSLVKRHSYLNSSSHPRYIQDHKNTYKIQRYCYKLHLHDKVGRSCTRRYLRWVKTKRMDLTVSKRMHFTFFCDNTMNIHLLLWYYKHYIISNDRSLSNRTRWLYILIEIMKSSGLSVSIHR